MCSSLCSSGSKLLCSGSYLQQLLQAKVPSAEALLAEDRSLLHAKVPHAEALLAKA